MKKIIMMMGSLLMLSIAAKAEMLVDYGFDQTNGVADASHINVGAGTFSWSTGGIAATDGKANPYVLPCWKKSGTAATLSFTLTPEVGFGASYANLSFAAQMDSATGTKERKLEITSSATGAEVLYTLYNFAAWQAAGSNPGDDHTTSDWAIWDVALTNSALQNVAGAVTFTLSFIDVSSGTPGNANMRLDDIGVDGTVQEAAPVNDVLADYGFDQTNGVADASAANLAAGDLVWNTGGIPAGTDGKISSDGLPQWKKSGTAATLSCTLTPDEGYGTSYSNLSFEIQMDSSSSTQRKMEVTSSATGMNILFAIYNAQYALDLGILASDPSRLSTDFESRSIDLSGWSELQDATAGVTFSFTFSGPGLGNANMRMDTFLLNGGVAVSTNTIPALLGYEMGTNTPQVVDASVVATVLNVSTNAGPGSDVVFDKTLDPDPTPGSTQPFLQVWSTNSRVQVTVEPDGVYSVDLSALVFEMQIQNSDRWVELTSDATGTNILWSVKTPGADTDAPQITTGFAAYSIDLSGIAELQGLAAATTFQFELFSDIGLAPINWRFDNIYVYGESALLPPTSIDDFAIGLVDGTNIVLGWQGHPAATYNVQRKLDLVHDLVWSNVVENIPGINGPMSVTNEAAEPKAFFRTILVD